MPFIYFLLFPKPFTRITLSARLLISYHIKDKRIHPGWTIKKKVSSHRVRPGKRWINKYGRTWNPLADSIFSIPEFKPFALPPKHKNRLWEFDLLLSLAGQSVALGLDTLLSPLTGGLVLSTLGVHLLLENTFTGPLGLGLLDLYSKKTSSQLIKPEFNHDRSFGRWIPCRNMTVS